MGTFRVIGLSLGCHRAVRLRSSELLRLTENPNIRGIVCKGRTDGGGAQLQARISALAFSRASGTPLLYAPFETIEHGSGAEWLSQWENFIDFRSGSEPLPPDAVVVPAHKAFNIFDRRQRFVASNYSFTYCDAHPEAYVRVKSELRSRCPAAGPVAKGVMAVHIRRGDAIIGDDNASRLTPMDRIARTIEIVRRTRPHLSVHVFSQGVPSDFQALPADCHLHLESDVFEALATMINAEVLMIAKSSFSYVAALLSEGTVIFEPFWHSGLPDWISVDELFLANERTEAALLRAELMDSHGGVLEPI
jgi:hypothetical protein